MYGNLQVWRKLNWKWRLWIVHRKKWDRVLPCALSSHSAGLWKYSCFGNPSPWSLSKERTLTWWLWLCHPSVCVFELALLLILSASWDRKWSSKMIAPGAGKAGKPSLEGWCSIQKHTALFRVILSCFHSHFRCFGSSWARHGHGMLDTVHLLEGLIYT